VSEGQGREGARLPSFVLLPAVLVAVGVLAYFTFRTTLQVERLRQQSVLEATLGLANEKADRLDKRIVEQDSVVFAIADPQRLSDLTQRWLPTAQRETPTVRAILVLDESHTVLAFASRAGGVFAEEEAFRRLLVQHMCGDMELSKQAPDELRHLHHAYHGQSYLVSYWQRVVPPVPATAAAESAEASPPSTGGRYLVVAWHDIGRIVKDTMPALFSEAATPSRVNVVDEDGRIIFGPTLRSGEFTVAVRFPTTLYGWRVQVSPSASDELIARVQNRAMLEHVMVVLSCIVIVLGVATIILAAERDRRISALKSDFVANVSHELKTPLALVRMFGEMLQSGRVTSDEKRQQYLDIIVGESERLSALIENVLDFARVERGRAAYDFSEGDVGEAVAKAVSLYRYRAEREGVDLSIELGADLPRAWIDARALELAVMNLIDNALKYAPGSAVIAVRADRGDEGDAIDVRVVDRGPGIPADDQVRIFERFVRGGAARGKAIRGSGIGLALVKHIAESHGGRAWVVSTVGHGATFVISIPVARSAHTPGGAGARVARSGGDAGDAGDAGHAGHAGHAGSPKVTPARGRAGGHEPENRGNAKAKPGES
jgi:two-component system, OmpR family, phosphate regulon sensor histidine kinase PhoR